MLRCSERTGAALTGTTTRSGVTNQTNNQSYKTCLYFISKFIQIMCYVYYFQSYSSLDNNLHILSQFITYISAEKLNFILS